MAVANGFGKVVTSGSVFMYDTGDAINSYIGEPTTNIFNSYGTSGAGAASNNAVNFDVQGTTGFIRLGYGQTFGGYTIKPTDVVYKYDLGGYGCHYHGNDVSIPSGKYVTFTFDFYVSPGAASYPITNFLANIETGTGTGMSVGAPNNLTGVWQTVSVTTGPSSSPGNIRMLLYPGACGGALAGDGYVLYKNPQVELLSHKTPFTQTSRSVTGSLLPIVGNSTVDLSNVSFDSNAQIVFDGTDDQINLSTNFGTVSQYTIEYVAYTDTPARMPIASRTTTAFYKFGANSWRYTHGGVGGEFYHTTGVATGWAHWVITYNGSTIEVFQNGNSLGSTSSSGTADFSDGFKIGYWAAGGSYAWNGYIPISKIYNRALSASEVKQNYNKYKSRFNLS